MLSDHTPEMTNTPYDETTGLAPPSASAAVLRGERWKNANAEHWHRGGYNEETRARVAPRRAQPVPRPPEEN